MFCNSLYWVMESLENDATQLKENCRFFFPFMGRENNWVIKKLFKNCMFNIVYTNINSKQFKS